MKKYLWLLLLVPKTAASQSAVPATLEELLAQARETYTRDGPVAALPKLEAVLAAYREAGNRSKEAITLGYIANCQRRLGNLQQALDTARTSLAMKEKLDDQSEIGKSHNQLGLIYWDLADYPSAIRELQQAIQIGETRVEPELEGSARNNLGMVFDEQGDFEASLKQYRRALELHRASQFARGEGDTLGNIGGVFLQLGRFREALDYYRQALEISRKNGLKPAQAEDLENSATCLKNIGEIDEALRTFDEAREFSRDAGLLKEEADARRGKGSVLSSLGRYDNALQEYAGAQTAYEKAGLKRELVESLNESGRLYQLLGDVASADKTVHRALQIAQEIGNPQGVITSTISLGNLAGRRKQFDVADSYFAQAAQATRKIDDQSGLFDTLVFRATNDLSRRRLDAAAEQAAEAESLASSSGNLPAIAIAAFIQGEVSRANGQLETALAQFESAETAQAKLRDPDLGWRILFGRGQVLQRLRRKSEALKAYKTSVQLIEQTRAGLNEERFRAGYIEGRFQVYVALVELLLDIGEPDQAFFYSEKLRTRAYFDQFGRAGLREDASTEARARELRNRIDALRDHISQVYAVPEKERRSKKLELFSRELVQAQNDYVAFLDRSNGSGEPEGANQVPSVADIQRKLPPDAALVEYVVGKQTITLLMLTRSTVRGSSTDVSSESLASRVELLRALISERKSAWTEPAKGLWSLLLGPLERPGYLQGVRTLILVPDGVLNYLPFSILADEKGRLLSDSYVVAYLPAAGVLASQGPRNASMRSLLALAPAESHLRNSASEVRTIAQMFPQDSLVLAGMAATKTRFKQVAGEYEYVHLATHGSLNRNAPWLSTLQLQPDQNGDGRLELHEILGLKLHARLVTLSACDTALGTGYFDDTPAGDEFVGMTRAFLGAGSQSVLASLWAVNDESTRDFMVTFYRYLRGHPGPEALALAQREFRGMQPRYGAPYFWAAFVLVGQPN
jgi:CHAT domain-containing protein/Tfp pilus assembly protein PilF